MSRFHITLVRPEGFLHTEAFREVAETLQCGLRSLGHTVHIQENAVDAMATNILLGAHLLSPEEALIVPPGSIVYNLEQLGGPHRLAPGVGSACLGQLPERRAGDQRALFDHHRCDRREGTLRIEVELVEQRHAAERADRRHQQGITIGRRARRLPGADRPPGTALVLDDHRLAEADLESLRHQTDTGGSDDGRLGVVA